MENKAIFYSILYDLEKTILELKHANSTNVLSEIYGALQNSRIASFRIMRSSLTNEEKNLSYLNKLFIARKHNQLDFYLYQVVNKSNSFDKIEFLNFILGKLETTFTDKTYAPNDKTTELYLSFLNKIERTPSLIEPLCDVLARINTSQNDTINIYLLKVVFRHIDPNNITPLQKEAIQQTISERSSVKYLPNFLNVESKRLKGISSSKDITAFFDSLTNTTNDCVPENITHNIKDKKSHTPIETISSNRFEAIESTFESADISEEEEEEACA